jgi:hypothetical protein
MKKLTIHELRKRLQAEQARLLKEYMQVGNFTYEKATVDGSIYTVKKILGWIK